jgi:hypothetical protein
VAADHLRAAKARPRTTTLDEWHPAAAAGRFEEQVVLDRLLLQLAPERRG